MLTLGTFPTRAFPFKCKIRLLGYFLIFIQKHNALGNFSPVSSSSFPYEILAYDVNIRQFPGVAPFPFSSSSSYFSFSLALKSSFLFFFSQHFLLRFLGQG